jgi:lipoprotein-releasing system permease protein
VSFFSIIGISIGLAALIIITSIISGMGTGIQEKIFDTPHLITKSEIKNNNIKESYNYGNKELFVSYKNKNNLFEVVSYDKEVLKNKIKINNVVESLLYSEKYTAIIPSSFSRMFGLEYENVVGKNIKLINMDEIRHTILGSFPLNINFKVIGMYYNVGLENKIYMSPESFSKITKRKKINKEMVLFEPLLINEINNEDIIYKWTDSFGDLYSAIEMEINMIYLFVISIITISLINLYSSLNILVNEKRKDIAIMKSFGFSNIIIYKIFIFKGFLNALIGCILGSTIGLLICYNFVEILSFFNVKGFYFSVNVNIKEVIIINLIILLLGIIVSLYPSYSAVNTIAKKELYCE